MRDRRGLKPSSAHGLRAQTEKWRSRRGNRAKQRREKESRSIAVVPLNLMMMGLYYPAILPVSLLLQQSSFV